MNLIPTWQRKAGMGGTMPHALSVPLAKRLDSAVQWCVQDTGGGTGPSFRGTDLRFHPHLCWGKSSLGVHPRRRQPRVVMRSPGRNSDRQLGCSLQ